MTEANILKIFIRKNSFIIFAIILYCIPYILSFSVNQIFVLIENKNHLQNIDCKSLYAHPNLLFNYLDIFVGLTSIIASIFLVRPIWDLPITRFLKWALSIVAFMALFGFSIFVPWFQTNVQLHKDRVLISVVNDLTKSDKKIIAIRLKYVKREIGMFVENRDFNIYNVVIVSDDPKVRKLRLPINFIKKEVSILEKNTKDIDCQIVIGNKGIGNFYLMDMGNNILGTDLKVIKYN